MFVINDKTKEIVLTQGNSCKIDITPYDEFTSEPIILQGEDRVIFTIKSPSGRKYFQRILTSEHYDCEEDKSLNLYLVPEDTIDLQPFSYLYDVLIVFENGETATFIDSSIFKIVQALGTIRDLDINTTDDSTDNNLNDNDINNNKEDSEVTNNG